MAELMFALLDLIEMHAQELLAAKLSAKRTRQMTEEPPNKVEGEALIDALRSTPQQEPGDLDIVCTVDACVREVIERHHQAGLCSPHFEAVAFGPGWEKEDAVDYSDYLDALTGEE